MLYKKQLLLLFKSSRKDPYDFIFQKEIPEQGIFPDKAEKFKDSLPSYFLISAFHPVSPSGGLPVFPVSLREQRTGGTASDYVHPSDVRSIGSDHLYIFQHLPSHPPDGQYLPGCFRRKFRCADTGLGQR